MDIISKIEQSAKDISEEDIDSWIIDEVCKFYKNRIEYWGRRAYSDKNSRMSTETISPVSILAFKEGVRSKLKNALKTFFLKKRHWENNDKNINLYLLGTIKVFSKEIYWDQLGIKKTISLVCPACRISGKKTFLFSESRMWRCSECTSEVSRIEEELRAISKSLKDSKSSSPNFKNVSFLQSRYRLCKAFCLHSRRGYKCPDCSRFIPHSIARQNNIICPYNDCVYSGRYDTLQSMCHPSSVSVKTNVSLNAPVKGQDPNGESTATLENFISSNDNDPSVNLDVYNQCKKELRVLFDVINDQLRLAQRTSSSGTVVQKILMYKAFKSMINKFPEEMVSYLVHLKQGASDFPIQARIFQEYAKLVENCLPFSIKKNNRIINIASLTDPNLSLFLGKSSFKATVSKKNTIPNKTEEEYIGRRKYKNYGPCFIGRLINVIDNNTGESILNKVIQYSFVQILMDNSVKPGTPVTVTHFRIPSHYEMNSLVFLQRIRRQIVDSAYFRLNGSQRVIRKRK